MATFNPDWSRVLAGVGQGLMSAGQPGSNLGNFGTGLMQGTQNYDQGVDRKRGRELEDIRLELMKQQQEQQRLANTKAAQEEAALQQLINGGGGIQTASAPNGMSQAQFGGAPTAPAQGGQPFFDAETQQKIRMLPPSMQRSAVEAQLGNMFAAPKEFKPNVEEFFENGQRVKGYLDQNGNLVKVGDSAPMFAPQQPQQAPATNLITLVGPKGEQQSFDSRDPQVKVLAGQGWVERQNSMFPAAPSGYRYTPTGGLEAVPQGPADPANPLNITGDQRKTGSFATRLEAANAIIDENEAVGTDYMQEGLSSVPLVGTMLSSPKKQALSQAQRDFVNAQLRRESGATIQDSEFDSAVKQYFPQPGEGPEIVAQKRQARKIAIENMKREAGAALPPAADNDPLRIR
jgi:hypothetical protein